MRIGKNIRELRELHNLSQADLARIAGVSDKAVSTWELGRKVPRMGALQRIADHFHITISDLIEGGEESYPRAGKALSGGEELILLAGDIRELARAYAAAHPLTRQSVCNQLRIPYIRPHARAELSWLSIVVYDDLSAACGPSYASSRCAWTEVPSEDVPAGADFGVRVSGDSMLPTIQDGQVVWVKRQDALRDQDVGIFALPGGAVLRRFTLPDRSPRLMSDNPAYPPISGDALAGMRVIGKVLLQ